MFKYRITGTFEINSNNPDIDDVRNKVHIAFLDLAVLHEPMDPVLQVGTVKIEECTLTTVIDTGFFTDTLSFR